MGILLELINEPDISIEAECLNPSLTGLNPAEIAHLKVWQGRTQIELGEFFSVKSIKTADEAELHIRGNLEKVKRIGQGLSSGRMVIHGNCGMHLGEGITGGEIEVHGNIGNWSLCLMQGGVARIYGSAGAFMGAAFPGDSRGMKGGTIWVQKDVGARAVERMRRGLLVVGGTLGEFGAAEMIAGTVVSLGFLKARAGASMKRGTIIAMGQYDPLICGFEKACTYTPAFTGLLGRELKNIGFIDDYSLFTKGFTRWCGDRTSLGKGEILIHEG
ncbi:MAG: formylmethanofuran dehydrogenase subunit C [Synergistaceae bacterium]|nr:formylmethanofuran dehydrogenase subunit C [Synergistaceae bacterium]MBP9957458.1 formylmethanofuran dehydrogenase subunit C [Synergistaceae bacterium]